MYVAWLRDSCRMARHRNRARDLFVIYAYAPADCSPDTVKEELYQQFLRFLIMAHQTDIVTLAGDLSVHVGRLKGNERQVGFDSYRSDNHQHRSGLNSSASPTDRCLSPRLKCSYIRSEYATGTGRPIQTVKERNAVVTNTGNTV